ncbi:MAG: D-alanyl-D-alanine carboxypeptidase [Treponema sp.]|nr:D-alanyl-D-alanine carboxypeptidase [Treponema sp.]
MSKKVIKFLIIPFITVFLLLAGTVGVRSILFSLEKEASVLSVNQKNELDLFLKNTYAEQNQIVKESSYQLANQNLSIMAKSAVLIDFYSGTILYSKNIDEVIPPASMTKLFAMYVVDEEVSAGRLKYDDYIYLPEETWACNMPPHSSLMFLGEGHKVTLDELLLGLSICSGNDAAYALAYAVCGNMDDFVSRMNQVAVELGLKHTHFVESSGYSEENTTTAREMAAFSRIYLQKHPDSLKKYHSVTSFTYPKQRNLADGDRLAAQDFSEGIPAKITMGITQKNTNPLLEVLYGCDGLKTGYIDESGYNLALTAARDKRRYISVTMKGPGRNSNEGQAGRVHDGTELMEYAFRYFTTKDISSEVNPVFMKVYGAKERSVNLVPAYDVSFYSVPFVMGNSLAENEDNLHLEYVLPKKMFGDILQGHQYGEIKIFLGDYEIESIPLVADRNVNHANLLIRLIDSIY